MKMLYLFLLLVFSSNAQLSYFAEYDGSVKTREIELNDLVVSNAISFGIQKNKMLYSVGIGREDWSLGYFGMPSYYKNKPNSFTYHCSTYKIVAMVEHQYLVPKTKLSLRFGLGVKVYFLNKLKESYTYENNEKYIYMTKPSVFENFYPGSSSNSFDGIKYGNLDNYSYITRIPLAVRANLALQYNFKKWALKLYYEPYVMSVRFRNAADPKDWGRTIIWFNDIGIGVNYQLNFKKKQEKEK